MHLLNNNNNNNNNKEELGDFAERFKNEVIVTTYLVV
jgi:hypothetical protein